MTELTEGRHAAEFLVSEANGHRSREAATIADSSAILDPGTVLGKLAVGTASSEADANNTGDGTMSAITVGAGAKAGDYILTFIAAETDAGAFQVEDPDGVNIGTGEVGSEFSEGGLTFTVSDGSADFVAGDRFVITVAEGSGKYAPLDTAGTDGSQNAAGVLYGKADVDGQDADATVVIRDCEVDGGALGWPDGITSGQKDAAIAALARKGIIVR